MGGDRRDGKAHQRIEKLKAIKDLFHSITPSVQFSAQVRNSFCRIHGSCTQTARSSLGGSGRTSRSTRISPCEGQDSRCLSVVCKLSLEHITHFLSSFAASPALLIFHVCLFEERQFILGRDSTLARAPPLRQWLLSVGRTHIPHQHRITSEHNWALIYQHWASHWNGKETTATWSSL